MLTSLRIQNFRSIRDASVKLGQVNLFIGPNNSGKTNFLKGINFFSSVVGVYPEAFKISGNHFLLMLPRGSGGYVTPGSINFSFKLASEGAKEHFIAINGGRAEVLKENFQSFGTPPFKIPSDIEQEKMPYYSSFRKELPELHKLAGDAIIYRIDPIRIRLTSDIKRQYNLSFDGENIISFLFNISQEHRKNYERIEKDFARCVVNLVSISTPVFDTEETKSPEREQKFNHFKLKFFDQNDIGYWAEEVSEGVLYFLALLCIVHQPNPPKLLMLEEPEKGIHPRRIKEVMDFIFELARLRDIQIILTSHSPYVVDHFKDIPNCVSVFDRDPTTGETVIHNAGDLIAETNKEYALQGLPPTDYTSSLGEYWVSGFLGGVPL